ncbi:cupredoxin domain-containing protein [Halorussus litoreus]|uniref:cupredoxin domain-containing protein n=1 Tax=Halorussus litoreus TaxID=1710536 RepID=UPI0013005C0C|nr:plastocyanin/azurin family copper-binding protein [Halorussus litoreus]
MTRDTDAHDGSTRRTFLQATAGAVALGGVAGLVGARQDGPQLIVLGGRTPGWRGVAPESIAGETNPTLPLVPGQDYRVRWTNVDGQPHNFVVLDSDGEAVVASDIIGTQDATQVVSFTASENMAEYYCEVHPTSMRGNVELVEEQQLEPVNETQLTNQTEMEPEGGQNATGNVTGEIEVSRPVGLGGQDYPNNTSQLQQFQQSRQQRFDSTGNGTARGNLTYGTNGTQTTQQVGGQENGGVGNETQGNETQDNRAGDVSPNDVRQVASAPGFGVLATLGGVFGGLAALSRQSDD